MRAGPNGIQVDGEKRCGRRIAADPQRVVCFALARRIEPNRENQRLPRGKALTNRARPNDRETPVAIGKFDTVQRQVPESDVGHDIVDVQRLALWTVRGNLSDEVRPLVEHRNLGAAGHQDLRQRGWGRVRLPEQYTRTVLAHPVYAGGKIDRIAELLHRRLQRVTRIALNAHGRLEQLDVAGQESEIAVGSAP